MLPMLAGKIVGMAVDTVGLCGLAFKAKFKELGMERLRELGRSTVLAVI